MLESIHRSPSRKSAMPLLTTFLMSALLMLASPQADAACRAESCHVQIRVNVATQRIAAEVNHKSVALPFDRVSTGKSGFEYTFEGNPTGRLQKRFSSRDYPHCYYKDMGDLPYSTLLEGGYRMSGSGPCRWAKLGTPQTHGSIIMRPETAKIIGNLVGRYRASNVWISIR